MENNEYRVRLGNKLRALIAVLEVAVAKIERSKDLPGTDVERLTKISLNLENTKSICERALQTLQNGLTQKQNKEVFTQTEPSMGYREYVELSSIDEYQKFKNLPPIKPEEVANTDIDQLIKKL